MKKRRFPRLNHPWAKSAAGFTLVELIVVIAIMGVLAGGATVGYSGYVKNAAKKADQTLVSNIVRAIETGINSTAFVPPASIDIGSTTYPIGFVVLSNNGGQILTSNSELVSNVTGECEIKSVEISYVTKTGTANGTPTCPNGSSACNEPVYGLKTKPVICCVTHSNITDETANVIDSGKPISYNHQGSESCGNCSGHKYVTNETYKVPAGTVNYVANEAEVYKASATEGLCELAHANQNGSFVRPEPGEGEEVQYTRVNGDHVLNQSIEAAFGSQNLKLQYDGWAEENEANINYATFYTYAPDMMVDVQDLGTKMANICDVMEYIDKDPVSMGFLGNTYGSAEEVVNALADAVTAEYGNDEAGWVNTWVSVHSEGWTGGGFGRIQQYGREYYSAVRKAYNSGFAAYLQANGVAEKYYNIISDFDRPLSEENETLLGLLEFGAGMIGKPIATDLPSLVNTDTFAKDESGLKEEFRKAGDTEYKEFERCQKLYEKYKTSEACKENARAFLDTMKTISATKDLAADKNNQAEGNYFQYYNNYLDEMAGIYNEATKKAKDGILIFVSSEDGKVKCTVSPSSADLRNSN